MTAKHDRTVWLRSDRYFPFFIITCLLFFCGCGINQPQQKPEGGPQGAVQVPAGNPPLLTRFNSPPPGLYDLDLKAGILYQSLNNENWYTAATDFQQLQTTWEQVKSGLGDEQSVQKGDESLNKLSLAISEQKVSGTFEALQGFIANAADLSKAFKLSPLTDILVIDNSVRNVGFYVKARDWKTADVKAKELDNAFGQGKVSFEKVGILSQITHTHNHVKQLVDAVKAQNAGSAEDHLQNINEGMAMIGQYYRGK